MVLHGEVAIITGAASGIGQGIAERFCREGARVAVVDIDHEKAQQTSSALGTAAIAVAADVSSQTSVEEMVEAVERRFGPVTILVNNAGVSVVVPFLELEEAVWQRHLDINLTGAFLCSQAVLKSMVPRRRGRIINISSQSGKQGNSQYQAYCASKFGLIGLTQSLAMEFAPHGITVNAICPGIVFTPLWEAMLPAYAEKRHIAPEQVAEYLVSRIPLRRLCTPEDVAGVAVFLASADGGYLTGQALNVNGGALMS
jgi:NAD(P)-dependent dehydrogenase (short-subunit alcohol dehydrogenase family)